MASAARVHAAERGLDIRKHALVATGGAGPVHACGVAERLGIGRVIVPPAAGVGSAFGLILSPISFNFGQSYVCRLTDLNLERLNRILDGLEAEGRRIVREAGVDDADVELVRTADMRYAGQGHEIRVSLPSGGLTTASVRSMQDAFDAEYVRLYGRTCEGVPVEAVNWRVNVSGPKPEILTMSVAAPEGSKPGKAEKGMRKVLFDPDDGPVETAVYDRYCLEPGFRTKGPAIVEEVESTTVVPPGWSMVVGEMGELVLVR